MTKRLTTLLMCLTAFGASVALAQVQPREDYIWVRDIGTNVITLDGKLDEAAWGQSESVHLKWNENAGFPGSGQKTDGTFQITEPTDPVDAMVHFLRKGNQLYVAVNAKDASVGGSRGLWNIDGLLMAVLTPDRHMAEAMNPAAQNNFAAIGEYIYSWWSAADTTDEGKVAPGAMPRFNGLFGSGLNTLERDAGRVAAWDGVTVVDGTANDDATPDVGYVMEMRVDLDTLGYNVDDPLGTVVPISLGIYDSDYQWPIQQDKFITTEVWFQNGWGNNFNEGAVLLMMSPTVDLDTPDAQLMAPEPDYVVKTAPATADFMLDGMLDEPVWDQVDYEFALQYKEPSAWELNPSFGRHLVYYFRPDPQAPEVVDPSLAKFKMFVRDGKLHVGVDVDDQLISGFQGENGDGVGLILTNRDSLDAAKTMTQYYFSFSVDSSGTVTMGEDVSKFNQLNEGAIMAAAHVKGASTIADPNDVDEGYQMEIVMDLTKVGGYAEDLGDRWLFLTFHLYDNDTFADPAQSYDTRTWLGAERREGYAFFGFMDPQALIVGSETAGELPTRIELDGNYPNPFNQSTTLSYGLPAAGEVMLRVYDVLGREVAQVNTGFQSAGSNRFDFNGASLAPGLYLYRLQMTAGGKEQVSEVGRMVLVR